MQNIFLAALFMILPTLAHAGVADCLGPMEDISLPQQLMQAAHDEAAPLSVELYVKTVDGKEHAVIFLTGRPADDDYVRTAIFQKSDLVLTENDLFFLLDHAKAPTLRYAYADFKHNKVVKALQIIFHTSLLVGSLSFFHTIPYLSGLHVFLISGAIAVSARVAGHFLGTADYLQYLVGRSNENRVVAFHVSRDTRTALKKKLINDGYTGF